MINNKYPLFCLVVLLVATAGVFYLQAAEIDPVIEDNCMGFLIGNDPDEIETAAIIGARWLRPHPGPFAWGWIESDKGEFDFDVIDRLVKEAGEFNMAILATIWPYADWDQEQCHKDSCKVSKIDQFYPMGFKDGIPVWRCAPCSLSKYKKFVSKIVERYDGDGIDDMPQLKVPIKYWEVLNEPEMNESFLTFFKGTASEYLDILKASYEAVKSSCSDCKVVCGGAAGTETKMLLFWKEVFYSGGGNYFDIANIHYIRSGDINTLNVKEFKDLLDDNYIDKPIWVTEAEFASENEVIDSSNGAQAAGASKIFYTQFKIGSYGVPSGGQYSEVYDLFECKK